MHTEFLYIPIEHLSAGQFQPRKDFNSETLHELAQSIASQGLIEPLVVRSFGRQRYEIIAGERRWRAAQLAGLKEVPCLVGEYSDKQACALTLIENIQRQDLNLLEEAIGYRRLIDEFNYNQEEIALLVGKSRSHIANSVRLLTLTQTVKNLICEQKLTSGHARALVGLDPKKQEVFAFQVIEEEWSVRQLERAIKLYKKNELVKPQNAAKDRDIDRLQSILAEQVGAPVQIINDSAEGGWLKVKFFNNDTLAGLLERLGLRYD